MGYRHKPNQHASQHEKGTLFTCISTNMVPGRRGRPSHRWTQDTEGTLGMSISGKFSKAEIVWAPKNISNCNYTETVCSKTQNQSKCDYFEASKRVWKR